MWKNIRMVRRRAVGALIACFIAGLSTGAAPAVASPAAPVAQAPAQALGLVSCSIVCDGQQPDTARYEDSNGVLRPCSDARTIYRKEDSTHPSWFYVELRYSRKCRMAWARGSGSDIKVVGFNAGGSFRVRFPKKAYWPVWWGPPVVVWTQVVNDAGLTAQACILKTSSPLPEVWECTPRY